QEIEEVLFSWGEVGPQEVRVCQCGPLPDARVGHGVILPHSLGDSGTSEPVRPVSLTGTLGHDTGLPLRDPNLHQPRSDSYPVSPAPIGEYGPPKTDGTLNLSDAAPVGKVLGGDQCSDNFLIPKVNWHTSTIITIADERYSGELCDLSVDADESYVA